MLGVCRITVYAVAHEDFLEIVVNDNGPGMDEETLAKIRAGIIKPQGMGIGLNNIDNRLKMIFGEGAGIAIASQLGEGTTVSIKIPKVERELDV